MSFDFLYLGMI